MKINNEDALAINELQYKFDRIENKNKCLRVRFLDWLSNKMLVWGKKIKETSDRIDTPCVIRVDKPVEHVSFFEEFKKADYFYDPSTWTYTDIKGLKAGKSLDECTFIMNADGRLTSRAELSNQFKVACKSLDAGLD